MFNKKAALNIQIVFAVISFIGLCILWKAEPESEILTKILCIVQGFYVIWALMSWRRLTGKWIDAYTIFLLALIIFNTGQPLLEIFNLNEIGMLMGRIPNYLINKSIMLVLTALIYFHLGALLSIRNSYLSPAKPMNRDMAELIRKFGLFLLAISILPQFYCIFQNMKIAMENGYMAIYQFERPTGFGTWYTLIAMFWNPGLLLTLGSSKQKPMLFKICWLLILITTILGLIIGGRFALILLLAAVWLHYNAISKIKPIYIYFGIFIVFMIIPFTFQTRNLNNRDKLTIEQFYEFYTQENNAFVASIYEMGNTMSTIAYTIELVPNTRGYDYGVGYLYSALTLIPNLFWDIHPTIKRGTPGKWLINEVDPFTADQGGSLGYSAIAEAYLNFSWFGCPLFLGFIGFLLGKYVSYARQAANLLEVSFEAVLVSILIIYARSESISIIRPLIFCFLIPYLYLKYKRNKSCNLEVIV